MNTTTVTLPDGKTETRNSKTRAPQFVVAGKGRNDGKYPEWAVINWCGSYELAAKAAAQRATFWAEMEIIAVD